jgi:LysR family transcriptional activator of glutamate synthase operon
MRQLEDQMNHKLFTNHANHFEPTEYGQIYLSYARRFQALDEELSSATAQYDGTNAHVVRLAVARTMNCDHIVNMLSDHFKDRYPDYSLSLGEFSRAVTVPQTFSLGYELVFAIGAAPADPHYNTFPWSTDRLVAILPEDHPLAKRRSLHLSELSNEKFILFPEGFFLNYYSLLLCREAGFEPMVDFTIHGTHNLAELVADGVGVSLGTSSDILTIKSHHVAMVEIEPSPPVYLNLYSRKDQPLSKAAQTFLDYAIEIHDTHSNDIPYLGPEADLGDIYFK